MPSSLSTADINEIESKAVDILSDVYGKNLEKFDPPISVKKIADKYGIIIKSGEFSDKEISGVYDRKAKSIYVSSSESEERKAFTVAHELGHHFLHEDKQEEIFYRGNAINLNNNQNRIEKQANWFAASLLMPKPLLIKAWEAYRSIDRIAELFGVSHTAAYFRLKNLGLID